MTQHALWCKPPRTQGLDKRHEKDAKAPSRKLLTGEPSCKDEARVGQKGGHAYIWAKRGSRPAMVRDNRYDSAYLYGAICPAHRKGAAVIMPAANR